jgi:hypothetical protein
MLEVGILKNFDSGTYKASVQLISSLTTYFDDVKVARNIGSGEMIPGRHVLMVIPEANPRNAVVIAVFTV